MQNRLRRTLAGIPGMRAFPVPLQNLRIGSRGGAAALSVHADQRQPGRALRQCAAPDRAGQKAAPGFTDVTSDLTLGARQLTLNIDRDALARFGLTMDVVRSTLYSAFGTRKIATVYTPSNDYAVILETDKAFTLDPSVLSKITIRSNTGQQVRFDAVATVTLGPGPVSVARQSQLPAVTITFNLAPGYTLGEAVVAMRELEREVKMPATITGQFAGTAQVFENSFRDQPILIAAAILTIYIVLGILYESFIHPITILSGLPSASLGALLILYLFDVELTIIAVIGIILLVGIVKKNAIMMVDFAIEARARGATPKDAIREACLLRFRPDHDDDHGGPVRHAADRDRLGCRAPSCASRWAWPWSAGSPCRSCSRSTSRPPSTSPSSASARGWAPAGASTFPPSRRRSRGAAARRRFLFFVQRHGEQGEGEGARQQADVGDLRRGGGQSLGQRGRLQQQRGRSRQRADHRELYGREADRPAVRRGAAGDHHVRCPEEGRDCHQQIATGKIVERAAAEQPGAERGECHSRPDQPDRQLAAQRPGDERRDDDVQRGEKSGVGDGGRHQAALLQPGSEEEGSTARDRHWQDGKAADAPVGPAHFAYGQRRQRQRRHRAARGDEGERTDVVHGRFLEHEGEAPDGGSKQQGQVGMQSGHAGLLARLRVGRNSGRQGARGFDPPPARGAAAC